MGDQGLKLGFSGPSSEGSPKIEVIDGKSHIFNIFSDTNVVVWILIWVWINTYENTIFSGMNIHKSQLF